MSLIENVLEILLRPGARWPKIRDEEIAMRRFYVPYAAILAAIPPVARLIGSTVIGMSFFGTRYRAPIPSALGFAVLSYALSLAGLFVFASIAEGLAPRFGSERSFPGAMKLSVYSSTAYWIAGILFVVPALWPLRMLLSLYGFYLLYVGLPVLLKTPRERVASFFFILMIVGVVLSALTGLIAILVFPEGRIGAA
jgi:hypothetical protein